jgi:hypothetical protein
MAKEIAAADAVKFFSGVTVQVAKATKLKGEDGRERPGFATKDESLAAAHVLAARDYGDRVVITTLDGQKHEAAKRGEKPAA